MFFSPPSQAVENKSLGFSADTWRVWGNPLGAGALRSCQDDGSPCWGRGCGDGGVPRGTVGPAKPSRAPSAPEPCRRRGPPRQQGRRGCGSHCRETADAPGGIKPPIHGVSAQHGEDGSRLLATAVSHGPRAGVLRHGPPCSCLLPGDAQQQDELQSVTSP